MSAGKERLELGIDVLDILAQRALVLPTLQPEELIASILQEFREIERLGIDPAAYQLIDATTGKALENQPIGVQYSKESNKIHLKLVERTLTAPRGAQSASEPVYLSEQTSSRVFKLNWLPAIIGRPDRNLPDNQLLAVNLETMPSGLRVSRRHALIGLQGNDYYVQRMSGNPTSLRRATGETVHLLDKNRVPILNGDVLYLERSQIALRFFVWRPESRSDENSLKEQEGDLNGE